MDPLIEALVQAVLSEMDKPFVSSNANAMTAMTRSPGHGWAPAFTSAAPCRRILGGNPAVLDRRQGGGARHLAELLPSNMPRRPALDRAAIDANDQSEPSSPNAVTSQSAPRSQRGRRGVHESAAAVASRGFRLLKIRSGATTYRLINHAALSSPEISGPTRSQTQTRFGGGHP